MNNIKQAFLVQLFGNIFPTNVYLILITFRSVAMLFPQCFCLHCMLPHFFCWFYCVPVPIPLGAMGWFVVCDCGIFWSHSIVFIINLYDIRLEFIAPHRIVNKFVNKKVVK